MCAHYIQSVSAAALKPLLAPESEIITSVVVSRCVSHTIRQYRVLRLRYRVMLNLRGLGEEREDLPVILQPLRARQHQENYSPP
jgi:hypothetical protein